MSETDAPDPAADPHAVTVHGRQFQPIWLIPIVALLIAGYLAVSAFTQRGKLITLTFNTAEGLKAGQTKVRHKAVDLGTVETIRLADDLSSVVVDVRMQREATAELTDKARFWVVRPRLTAGNITGLDTLVSGAYIEMDPGPVGESGRPMGVYKGLEDPPAVRSDEPGTAFTLTTGRIGGLSSGSPVLYRDIVVGEVLNWALAEDQRTFTVQLFVRRPFDQMVHTGTHFWNASGVSVDLGANGVQLKVQNLQAVLSGAVAFDTAAEARGTPAAPADSKFRLYRDEQAATSASFARNLPLVTRFDGSVRGLAVGAPVEFYGIQVGTVIGINLVFDPSGKESHVDVRYDLQPERLMPLSAFDGVPGIETARNLVRRGMRAQLHTGSLVTGQLFLGLDFFPNAAPAEPTQMLDGTIQIPGIAGGLDNLTATVSALAAEVAKIPFAQIGADLEATLHGLSGMVNGPEVKQSVTALATTLKQAQTLVAHLDDGSKRLPQMAESLDTALKHTNALLVSAQEGYGAQSQTRRDLDRLISQATDTARSLRLLADYLKDHPESLIQGRSTKASEK